MVGLGIGWGMIVQSVGFPRINCLHPCRPKLNSAYKVGLTLPGVEMRRLGPAGRITTQGREMTLEKTFRNQNTF